MIYTHIRIYMSSVFVFSVFQGFKVSAEQQLSEYHLQKISDPNGMDMDLEMLREAALSIYDQYISDKVHFHTYTHIRTAHSHTHTHTHARTHARTLHTSPHTWT